MAKCKKCNGSGYTVCKKCKGLGGKTSKAPIKHFLSIYKEVVATVNCDKCGNTGRKKCKKCKGTGMKLK